MSVEDNNFLENLIYRISLKNLEIKTHKKFPVFSPTLVKNEEEFDRIHIRDKYEIIIEELDKLIKNCK